MAPAIWNQATLGESARPSKSRESLFPPESVKPEFSEASAHTTVYPWKEPKTTAANIQDDVAFWKGVAVES